MPCCCCRVCRRVTSAFTSEFAALRSPCSLAISFLLSSISLFVDCSLSAEASSASLASFSSASRPLITSVCSSICLFRELVCLSPSARDFFSSSTSAPRRAISADSSMPCCCCRVCRRVTSAFTSEFAALRSPCSLAISFLLSSTSLLICSSLSDRAFFSSSISPSSALACDSDAAALV